MSDPCILESKLLLKLHAIRGMYKSRCPSPRCVGIDVPEVLPPLRDLVVQSLLQRPHVVLQVGQLQHAPDVLVTDALKRVQVHPQAS